MPRHRYAVQEADIAPILTGTRAARLWGDSTSPRPISATALQPCCQHTAAATSKQPYQRWYGCLLVAVDTCPLRGRFGTAGGPLRRPFLPAHCRCDGRRRASSTDASRRGSRWATWIPNRLKAPGAAPPRATCLDRFADYRRGLGALPVRITSASLSCTAHGHLHRFLALRPWEPSMRPVGTCVRGYAAHALSVRLLPVGPQSHCSGTAAAHGKIGAEGWWPHPPGRPLLATMPI
eukprot:366082-Chlamydomonas_euryale.AAC.31